MVRVADLPDPRLDRTKKHSLNDILVIALSAVICGADLWEEVETFGEAKKGWLRTFLALPNGIPSHDTFYRVFSRLDPDKFGACVAGWMAGVCEAKHKLDNGSQYEVAGIDEKGIHLTNDWTLAPDFGHLNHGYVTTSHASQGKTVERVLIAMGKESLPAISAEQFYVSVSRGKEKATIFTDVLTPELREAIQKADSRKSATELFNPQRRNRVYAILKRAREAFQNLRTRHVTATHERGKQREHFNGR